MNSTGLVQGIHRLLLPEMTYNVLSGTLNPSILYYSKACSGLAVTFVTLVTLILF